jgi:hypothetical protein
MTAYESVRNTLRSAMPTLSEGLLFIILCVIVLIIVNLFHYTFVQNEIKKTSRCYKEKMQNTTGQFAYSVKALSVDNKEIYEVVYDFKLKNSVTTQLCIEGSILNKFKIPLYDMKTNSVQEVEKIFGCEEKFDSDFGMNIIYTGHPELVRFMQFQNTDFFDKKLFSE